MHAKVELPKAIAVRDEHEFLPVQHLLERLNPQLTVREVVTGVHVDGGGTVHWGLVYLKGEPPSRKKVEKRPARGWLRLCPQCFDSGSVDLGGPFR